MSTATYLAESVHQNKALSKTGLLERLFTHWFKGMVYNQIWEDPKVDAEALHLDTDSRILTISSGGCNILNYLTHTPAHITAVDLNDCHLKLAQLKIAGIRHFTHEEFFRFFGQANQPGNSDLYFQKLRNHLDDATQEYWENPWPMTRLRYFTQNLYNFATMGYFLRLIHGAALVLGVDSTAILRAKSLEEQAEIFDRDIAPFFDSAFMKSVTKLPFFLHALGVPPRQYELFVAETQGKVLEEYKKRVRRMACDFPIQTNYFAWQAFGRKYDVDNRQGIPDYMKAEHFANLKANIHKVATTNTKLTPFLEAQSPGSFNRFVFLDAQDWMTNDELNELWSEVARVAPVGGRVIFRTGTSSSPLEEALAPELMARFRYYPEQSKAFHAQDRSSIYGGFHLYEKIA